MVTTPSGGHALRFTAIFKLSEDHWQRTEGCLATRSDDGAIGVSPPAQYFFSGGRRKRTRNVEWSKKVVASMVKHIEAMYGDDITLGAAKRGGAVDAILVEGVE